MDVVNIEWDKEYSVAVNLTAEPVPEFLLVPVFMPLHLQSNASKAWMFVPPVTLEPLIKKQARSKHNVLSNSFNMTDTKCKVLCMYFIDSCACLSVLMCCMPTASAFVD